MAYNPNVPAPTNRVQDDIAAMRGNFQHLAPLAQLAPVASGLQTVSELAPYVQALLDSRIVEEGSNANGSYARWQNGIQLCWWSSNVATTATKDERVIQGISYYRHEHIWTFPASFVGLPSVVPFGRQHEIVIPVACSAVALSQQATLWFVSPIKFTDFAIAYRGALAMGRWK